MADDMKIKDELVRSILMQRRNPQPGSAFWRMVEVFRGEVSKDTDANIFNDQFADGLAQLRREVISKVTKFLLVMYGSGVLLLLFLFGYTPPLTFPYIGNLLIEQPVPHSIFEIAFITFLIASANLIIYTTKSALYEKILQAFVDVRYGEKVRDFFLLRWGLDDLTFYLHGEDYAGYARAKKQGRFLMTLSTLDGLSTGLIFVAQVVIVAGGCIEVIKHPAFGWLSFLITGGALIYFLKNYIDLIRAAVNGGYAKVEAK